MPSSSLHDFIKPIIHVDCDAFFTSVEQALDPTLKGKPIVTGRERGIVACASYEAKARGVRRPMRLFEAQKICPELVCIPSNYETYSLYSKRLFSIIRRFTPVVEEYSIDEAFAELSGLRRLFRMDYESIARKIKDTVEKELGLTVSVGLSSSRTLAKLASGYQKPNGFTVFPVNELEQILKSIPVRAVCGFGPNLSALLNKQGVFTILDYVTRSEAWAQKIIGKIGVELWHELRGNPIYSFVTAEKHDYASISKCKTFTPPSTEEAFVRAQLVRNVESAFIKLRRHHLRARGIGIHLRDQTFKTQGIEAELERSTSSTIEGVALAVELFQKIFKANKPYRLTGVVLFKIDAGTETQYSLFDDVAKIKSLSAIDGVIDAANELYGKHSLHLGAAMMCDEHRQHQSERGDIPHRKKDLFRGESTRQRLGIPVWNLKV